MALMEEFVANGGNPIAFTDRVLHWTYYIPVASGTVVEIRFRDFARVPVQGLAIDCDDCVAEVVGTRSRKFQLWTDSAPERILMKVIEARPGARLAIFNTWTDAEHVTTLYRLNNAAILPSINADGSVTLGCSDGVGPPEFSDLVVDLRLVSKPLA
jgi:hypothetical protein